MSVTARTDAATPAVPTDRLVLYEVFVRQHGPHGTFADVEADLPRIRDLGVDVVWLMPIHPIGAIARKGSVGSPYSIADHRAVNPDLGTREDLRRLLDRAHGLGLRVMIDVVYNHTAHDSRLVAEHPEFFHQDAAGLPVTTVPDWSDVIDLRHGDPALTEELIATLEAWVDLGVDGFRCDVASIVPPAFWRAAVDRIEARRPGVIWLAESVHAAWVGYRRAAGLSAWSDPELYLAGFDLTYDYDIWPLWQAAVEGVVPVDRYLEIVRFQACVQPTGFTKMRCVENHDNPRIQRLAGDPALARAWTALTAFLPGALLLYAGQESAAHHTPTLFEVDPIAWGGYELSGFLGTLARLKKDPALDGDFQLVAAEPAVQASWRTAEGGLYGVFAVGRGGDAAPGSAVGVQLPDGTYRELLSGRSVTVQGGRLPLPADAAILRVDAPFTVTPMAFPLLDHRLPEG